MLEYTKCRNFFHSQVSAHYHLNKTFSQHNPLQNRNCKGGHIKMTAIIKIGFTFAMKLPYPVIIEISGWQESLLQQLHELLRQFHHQ